jgi:hypothetical protein
MNTAERTRLALEKLTNGKIKAAQPSRVSARTLSVWWIS